MIKVVRNIGPCGKLFEILKSDFRGVEIGQCGFIEPGSGLEKIFGIRVVGEVPIKIAMSLAKFDQPLKESFPGDGLFRIGAGLNCPMMFKACVNSTGGICPF